MSQSELERPHTDELHPKPMVYVRMGYPPSASYVEYFLPPSAELYTDASYLTEQLFRLEHRSLTPLFRRQIMGNQVEDVSYHFPKGPRRNQEFFAKMIAPPRNPTLTVEMRPSNWIFPIMTMNFDKETGMLTSLTAFADKNVLPEVPGSTLAEETWGADDDQTIVAKILFPQQEILFYEQKPKLLQTPHEIRPLKLGRQEDFFEDSFTLSQGQDDESHLYILTIQRANRRRTTIKFLPQLPQTLVPALVDRTTHHWAAYSYVLHEFDIEIEHLDTEN